MITMLCSMSVCFLPRSAESRRARLSSSSPWSAFESDSLPLEGMGQVQIFMCLTSRSVVFKDKAWPTVSPPYAKKNQETSRPLSRNQLLRTYSRILQKVWNQSGFTKLDKNTKHFFLVQRLYRQTYLVYHSSQNYVINWTEMINHLDSTAN